MLSLSQYYLIYHYFVPSMKPFSKAIYFNENYYASISFNTNEYGRSIINELSTHHKYDIYLELDLPDYIDYYKQGNIWINTTLYSNQMKLHSTTRSFLPRYQTNFIYYMKKLIKLPLYLTIKDEIQQIQILLFQDYHLMDTLTHLDVIINQSIDYYHSKIIFIKKLEKYSISHLLYEWFITSASLFITMLLMINIVIVFKFFLWINKQFINIDQIILDYILSKQQVITTKISDIIDKLEKQD